jgi:hypothetical protein
VRPGDRVTLAVDWQWGDRYLRAGLAGTVIARDPFGRIVVTLDCFTADSAAQVLDPDALRTV